MSKRTPTADVPPPFRGPRETEAPHATISQDGAFSWFITVTHGFIQWGPDGGPHWHIGTEAGARRRAARLLRAYERYYARTHPGFERRIEVADPDAYVRREERRRATQRALEELRNPEAVWDREFASLGAATPRRMWRRREKR